MLSENQSWSLHGEFSIRQLSNADFKPLLKKHVPEFFDSKAQIFRVWDALEAEEKAKAELLMKDLGSPIEFRLGLFEKDRFIGWSYSRQEMSTLLYMQSSAVFPEFRRHGLYTELVKKTVELAHRFGFLSVFSRHVTTNNAVIIAKLKLGFKITAMELTDNFGSLVHLTYYPNKTREKILDYRAGWIKPDAQVNSLLKINS